MSAATHKPDVPQTTIWLVGMMGSGKSSVGPLLARSLDRPFVDTDALIEQSAGRAIPEIFREQGESAFRALEAKAIGDAAQTGGVVALGGGAIAQPGASERLASLGTVVYLCATPKVLLRRIGNPEGRPLLAAVAPEERLAWFTLRLAEREPAYRSASLVVDTDDLNVETVARQIEAELANEERAR